MNFQAKFSKNSTLLSKAWCTLKEKEIEANILFASSASESVAQMSEAERPSRKSASRNQTLTAALMEAKDPS